ALADEAALHGELQLIIGRLEDFATKLHNGLETADWASQRDLIRALVKRVEVARNEVNVVFRIDPYPSDNDPEKKSLQLCRGRDLLVAGVLTLGYQALSEVHQLGKVGCRRECLGWRVGVIMGLGHAGVLLGVAR